ncbi:MAG: rhomboid family intramembrane serine protease [Truepera sp.]|nr:rhomboid family intramembrane serine protease [Truepera sp.]
MSQEQLLLAILIAVGLLANRYLVRLAPAFSELPLKTLLATTLSALALASSFGLLPLSFVTPLALLAALLFTVVPLSLPTLVRARLDRLAAALITLFYWTPAGRHGLYRLLAQTALQRGDHAVALRYLGGAEDDLLRAQAYALQERWEEMLALTLPSEGDNAYLGRAARVQAYLGLGRWDEAELELGNLAALWQRGPQGPLGYRALTLSKARLQAARGNFEATRQLLATPLSGVAGYQLFDILGLAAERAQQPSLAAQIYAQAYANAPSGQQGRFAAKLKRYGQPLPAAVRRFGSASLTLTLAIIGSYLLQLLIDQRFGTNAGSLTAGFLLNIPGIPEADALWRMLSYAFVHGNPLHIAMNSWVLFDIGRVYESRRHWGSLLGAFVFGTAMGAYLTIIAQRGDQVILVGASAGVLGIVGALLADAWRSPHPQDRQLTRGLLQWIAIIGLFSLLPGISFWGHAGGLVGGLLWGFIRQGLPANRSIDLLVGGLSIGVLAFGLTSAAQWFFRYSAQL